MLKESAKTCGAHLRSASIICTIKACVYLMVLPIHCALSEERQPDHAFRSTTLCTLVDTMQSYGTDRSRSSP